MSFFTAPLPKDGRTKFVLKPAGIPPVRKTVAQKLAEKAQTYLENWNTKIRFPVESDSQRLLKRRFPTDPATFGEITTFANVDENGDFFDAPDGPYVMNPSSQVIEYAMSAESMPYDHLKASSAGVVIVRGTEDEGFETLVTHMPEETKSQHGLYVRAYAGPPFGRCDDNSITKTALGELAEEVCVEGGTFEYLGFVAHEFDQGTPPAVWVVLYTSDEVVFDQNPQRPSTMMMDYFPWAFEEPIGERLQAPRAVDTGLAQWTKVNMDETEPLVSIEPCDPVTGDARDVNGKNGVFAPGHIATKAIRSFIESI